VQPELIARRTSPGHPGRLPAAAEANPDANPKLLVTISGTGRVLYPRGVGIYTFPTAASRNIWRLLPDDDDYPDKMPDSLVPTPTAGARWRCWRRQGRQRFRRYPVAAGRGALLPRAR